MPKIIFTSQYMRDDPPAQLENYVKYIGTRDGVEKIDVNKLSLPVTGNQQLITQLLHDIPAAKTMLEYAYRQHPTIGNATEFISLALEQNLNLISPRLPSLLLGGERGASYRQHNESEREQRKPFVLP